MSSLLERIYVEGFRGFRGATSVPIRPLTLVFGSNSAGKSSLLRGFAALAWAVRTTLGLGRAGIAPFGFPDGSPVLDPHRLRLGAVDQEVTDGCTSMSLGFAVPNGDDGAFFAANFLKGDEGREVDSRQLSRVRLAPSRSVVPTTYVYDGRTRGWHEESPDGVGSTGAAERSTDAVIPTPSPSGEHANALRALRAAVDRVRYLPPLRGKATHSGDVTRSQDQEEALDWMVADGPQQVNEFLRPKRRDDGLPLDPSLGFEVGVGGGRLTVRLKGSDRERPLNQVGTGVEQVLPLLPYLAGRSEDERSILLVEQPELHLHPALHVRLTDALVLGAMNGNTVVAETHSDHVVRRLGRLIRAGLPRDLVQILYVGSDEGGSYVLPLDFTEIGDFYWPEAFFEDPDRESFR